MNVIICEENPVYREFFDTCCVEYNDPNMDHIIFSSLPRLMTYLEHNPEPNDVYILDYKMVNEDRDDSVSTYFFHRRDQHALFILTSEDPKVLEKAFCFGAFRFLPKPFVTRRFFGVLDQCSEQLKRISNNFVFIYKRKQKILYVHDIMYFEKDKRSMTVHMKDGTSYTFNMTLKNALKVLNADIFVPTSASFIANYEYAFKINRESVTLCNNVVLPVTRNYRKLVIEKFHVFSTYHTYCRNLDEEEERKKAELERQIQLEAEEKKREKARIRSEKRKKKIAEAREKALLSDLTQS